MRIDFHSGYWYIWEVGSRNELKYIAGDMMSVIGQEYDNDIQCLNEYNHDVMNSMIFIESCVAEQQTTSILTVYWLMNYSIL